MRLGFVWIVRGVVAAAVLVSGVAMVPSAALAGSGGAATPFVPTPVTVGQTGIAASITLENRNNGTEAALTNTVCNAGDASPPCGTLVHGVFGPELGIVFTPSCSQVAGGECTVVGAEPGVFNVSSTASGRVGTACAGLTFSTSMFDATTGAVRFSPLPLGTHVTLPGANTTCVIDFSMDVLRVPSSDQSSGTAGVQTAQTTSFTSVTGTFGPASLSNFARGSSSVATVNLATPTISTTASSDVVLGSGSISDTATVTGRVSPTGSPTVTFQLYGPNDATCATTAIFTSTVAYPSNGGPVASGAFTPTAPGT